MSLKFYNKSLALCTSWVVLISTYGCSKKSENYSSYSQSSNVNDVVTTTLPVTSSVVTTTSSVDTTSSVVTTTGSVVTNLVVTTTKVEDVINNKDEEVLSYFSEMGTNLSNSYNLDSFLESGKKYFIYCVDFLFYDSEINGIRFNDLTDLAKQQLLRDINAIDELICSRFPNYKEDIGGFTSDAYNKAALIIKEGSNDIKDFSKEKLGDENYNKISYYKDMVVSQTKSDFEDFKDILGDGKQFVKNWYEGLK